MPRPYYRYRAATSERDLSMHTRSARGIAGLDVYRLMSIALMTAMPDLMKFCFDIAAASCDSSSHQFFIRLYIEAI
jgi:hypothetical protein